MNAWQTGNCPSCATDMAMTSGNSAMNRSEAARMVRDGEDRHRWPTEDRQHVAEVSAGPSVWIALAATFETPERADLPALRSWLAADRFPDGTIFHQHYDYCAGDRRRAGRRTCARLVTIVRDPYDAFVSTYYTLQQHAAEKNQKGRKFTELMGKPLDDPAVIEFLRRGRLSRTTSKKRATGR